MAEPCFGEAKYLVLHFEAGKLWSTKVCATWRGAQMSKRNFERLVGDDRALVKVLPIDAVLSMRGIDAPSNELSQGDISILAAMGITA